MEGRHCLGGGGSGQAFLVQLRFDFVFVNTLIALPHPLNEHIILLRSSRIALVVRLDLDKFPTLIRQFNDLFFLTPT